MSKRKGALNPTEANDEHIALKFTLGDLLRRYGDEVSPTKKGGDLEVVRIKALCRKRIAKFAVGNLTTQVFAAFRDDRLKEVTGSTVNREFNLIHHVLEIARKEWRILTLAEQEVCPSELEVRGAVVRTRRRAALQRPRRNVQMPAVGGRNAEQIVVVRIARQPILKRRQQRVGAIGRLRAHELTRLFERRLACLGRKHHVIR